MRKLSTLWTRGLKGKEKEDFESLVRNSTQILSRLQEVIEEQESSIYQKEAEGESYSEGWQHLQAHRNGMKEAFRIVSKMTDHLKEDHA